MRQIILTPNCWTKMCKKIGKKIPKNEQNDPKMDKIGQKWTKKLLAPITY